MHKVQGHRAAQGAGVNADLIPPTGGHVGHACRYCSGPVTHSTLARKSGQLGLCLSILRMTLTVVLLCGMQKSNHIMLVLDTYVHYTLYRESFWTWTNGRTGHFFVYTLCPQNTKPDNFCTILFRIDKIL